MEQVNTFFQSKIGRIIFVLFLAIGAHILVLIIKRINHFISNFINSKKPKWNSIRTLGASILIFIVYFVAFGFILKEMGISLTAYIASASVIGLAVGFGTQGVIQDVITGLTIVFSDLIDVGDLVEINGVTGIVKSINMRFIEIEDPLKAKAYIPNRTVNKVINYPKGYISCCIDITLTEKEFKNEALSTQVTLLINSVKEQFETIFRGSISFYNDRETASGKKYTRIKMRIWPGRGNIIESSFKNELLAILIKHNPDYKDWMVAINYEIENNKNGNGTRTKR